MNRTIFLPVAIVLGLAMIGCGQPYMEEAYHLDREFGIDSTAAFDKQIANPEPEKIDVVPEGLDGIHAEQMMGVHDATYGEEPTEDIVLKMGLAGEGK